MASQTTVNSYSPEQSQITVNSQYIDVIVDETVTSEVGKQKRESFCLGGAGSYNVRIIRSGSFTAHIEGSITVERSDTGEVIWELKHWRSDKAGVDENFSIAIDQRCNITLTMQGHHFASYVVRAGSSSARVRVARTSHFTSTVAKSDQTEKSWCTPVAYSVASLPETSSPIAATDGLPGFGGTSTPTDSQTSLPRTSANDTYNAAMAAYLVNAPANPLLDTSSASASPVFGGAGPRQVTFGIPRAQSAEGMESDASAAAYKAAITAADDGRLQGEDSYTSKESDGKESQSSSSKGERARSGDLPNFGASDPCQLLPTPFNSCQAGGSQAASKEQCVSNSCQQAATDSFSQLPGDSSVSLPTQAGSQEQSFQDDQGFSDSQEAFKESFRDSRLIMSYDSTFHSRASEDSTNESMTSEGSWSGVVQSSRGRSAPRAAPQNDAPSQQAGSGVSLQANRLAAVPAVQGGATPNFGPTAGPESHGLSPTPSLPSASGSSVLMGSSSSSSPSSPCHQGQLSAPAGRHDNSSEILFQSTSPTNRGNYQDHVAGTPLLPTIHSEAVSAGEAPQKRGCCLCFGRRQTN